MQIIEYEKLDELIEEYIDKKIPLAILVSENNVSYKQINYIIKTIKEMLHIIDNNSYTNEDYKNMLKFIENIDEKLKDVSLPNTERIKLEYDKESVQEDIIKSSKTIFDDTINIFFNNVDLKEDIYSYCNVALADALYNYNTKSRVNFIALLTSKIIKTICNNFEEIMGIPYEEYSVNIKSSITPPKIVDIDEILNRKFKSNKVIPSEDDEKFEEEYFISEDNVNRENILEEKFDEALKGLSEVEAQIIRLRYGLNGNDMHTYAEISQELNRPIDRIKFLEEKALRKLRFPTRSRIYRASPYHLREKNDETLNDRIYLKLIDLLIHDINYESIIKFINMEGVNWKKEDYVDAILKLNRMIKKIHDLKKIKNIKNKDDVDFICNAINRDTERIFSKDFLEKLIIEYSSNQGLLDKLNIDESEMKL